MHEKTVSILTGYIDLLPVSVTIASFLGRRDFSSVPDSAV